MGEKIRKLAAIMFTDIVGYSRMMSVDERHGLELLERHDELLMPILLKHGGRVLKKIGDAIFAEFTSSVNAVESAIDIQTTLKEYNQSKEPKDHIVIRIGIHMGDVVVHNDDLFGEGINVAARLEPLAEPGGICMSQAVYQSVRAHMGVDAIKVGEVELKNILEKHIIYKIPTFYAESAEIEDLPGLKVSQEGIRDLKIKPIQNLPSPSRSAWGIGIPAFFILLFFITCILAAGTTVGYSKVRYLIWGRDIIDPWGLVAKIQKARDIPMTQIRAQMKRKTIKRVDEFDTTAPETGSSPLLNRLTKAVRKDLNHLIKKDRAILDGMAMVTLSLAEETGRAVKEDSGDDDIHLINRRLLEAVLDKEIEIFDEQQSRLTLFAKALGWLWTEKKAVFFSYLSFILIYASLFTFLAVYTLSLKSIKISFLDVRDVDKVLEYFVEQIGFKTPTRVGEHLIFRAKPMTVVMWNVFKMKATVNGNTIILTGPLRMVLKFRKQIESFASQE